jgi:formylglycine-generating enzyme
MKWITTISILIMSETAFAQDSTTWMLVEIGEAGRYWQNQSTVPEDAISQALRTIESELESLGIWEREQCPQGMVHVEGAMMTLRHGSIEWLQDRACIEWLDPPDATVRRCSRFDRDTWLEMSSDLPTREMDFCIDRFEYPNRIGEYPAVSVTWYEATEICTSMGRRLCSEEEWTFACEGEEATPYPYGYERDSAACNIDRPWLDYSDVESFGSLSPRSNAGQAISLLWQGAASGEYPECRSPFGVYDMTGNVDEWTTSVRSTGRQSIMKGGYWSGMRNRCRPSTRVHGPSFVFYQQGFRCCSDTQESALVPLEAAE